ncbi:MAG: hypothetical protein OEN23_15240 [Paracoccaceae bacterium]|nr:hypothetical protein [Paracoccaceae bacterium]
MARRLVNPIAGAIAALAASAAAASEEPPEQGLWADISIEIEDEFVFSASDPDTELNDTFTTIEGDFGLTIGEGFGIRGLATFEPVKDPQGDRFMEDFGLFLEEVYVYGRLGRAGLRAGKFNPYFDLANDLAPGLYGDDLAGDYELTERLGAALALPVIGPGDGPGGEIVLHASVFVADRTPLSDSLFSGRGRVQRADGGLSNTDYPQSVALAATGEAADTVWNLGARFQNAGGAGEHDETGFVAGLSHMTEIAGYETQFFAELAHFENFDGEPPSASVATLAFEIGLADLALSAAYGLKESPGVAASHLATLSLEGELAEGLTLGAGYQFLDDEGSQSHTLGLLLNYEFSLGR